MVEPDDQRRLTEQAIATGFDANGNLQRLQAGGPTLLWVGRNQLQQVRPVRREDGSDDTEWYVYDGGGQRVRKISRRQARGRELTTEVRYLPGLELRRNSTTGEVLQVISAPAGRGSVRCWTGCYGGPVRKPRPRNCSLSGCVLPGRSPGLKHPGAG